MVDTISDLINRINNAKGAGKNQVAVPYSRFKYEVAKVLGELGYFGEIQTRKADSLISIAIQGKKNFDKIARLSKPGRRVYSKSHQVPRPKGGYGEVVVSTPRGVLSGRDARRLKAGGEIICEVY